MGGAGGKEAVAGVVRGRHVSESERAWRGPMHICTTSTTSTRVADGNRAYRRQLRFHQKRRERIISRRSNYSGAINNTGAAKRTSRLLTGRQGAWGPGKEWREERGSFGEGSYKACGAPLCLLALGSYTSADTGQPLGKIEWLGAGVFRRASRGGINGSACWSCPRARLH
ncbi:hypothetical protein L209DRAFT_541994 [Thermothelomyces heterothallicus CBS 203.75]